MLNFDMFIAIYKKTSLSRNYKYYSEIKVKKWTREINFNLFRKKWL